MPWGIVFLTSGNALVGERNSGRLLRVSPNGKVTTMGTVQGVVAPSGLGEGGLLGLAIDPDDQDTLYAYITTGSDNRVVRLSIAGGKLGKPKAILTGIPTSTHHHGGKLLFAPDKTLFVSAGDAERSALAQSKSSLAGKILPIRRDGRAAAGNPYRNRTWSYGHRNIEGLAFDAAGRLWSTEFGDKEADELNLVSKGKNYGWPSRRQVPGLALRLTASDLDTDQQLFALRSGHHPVHRLRRRTAGALPVQPRSGRYRGRQPESALPQRLRPDP